MRENISLERCVEKEDQSRIQTAGNNAMLLSNDVGGFKVFKEDISVCTSSGPCLSGLQW